MCIMQAVGRVPILIFLACVALAIAGCGSGDDSSNTTSGDSTSEVSANTSESGEAANTKATTKDKPTKAEEESGYSILGEPGLPKPVGPPPKQPVRNDVAPGAGKVAKDGDEVTVHYVGFSFKTGKEFDSSWDREEPMTFTLGAGEVIPGWDQGIVGMKENGRSELIIPPYLAYGSQGSPPAVKPNETLVFVIDLLSVGQ